MAKETARTNPGDEAPPGTPGTGEDVCPECNGTGKVQSGECPACGGTGKIVRAIGGAQRRFNQTRIRHDPSPCGRGRGGVKRHGSWPQPR